MANYLKGNDPIGDTPIFPMIMEGRGIVVFRFFFQTSFTSAQWVPTRGPVPGGSPSLETWMPRLSESDLPFARADAPIIFMIAVELILPLPRKKLGTHLISYDLLEFYSIFFVSFWLAKYTFV